MRENKSELIDPYDYTKVVKQLRSFFDNSRNIRVHGQEMAFTTNWTNVVGI